MLKFFRMSDNYLTVRAIEHAWEIRFTKEEFERLLKKLDDNDIKNGRNSETPRPKIQS